jgi:hypothetical protein
MSIGCFERKTLFQDESVAMPKAYSEHFLCQQGAGCSYFIVFRQCKPDMQSSPFLPDQIDGCFADGYRDLLQVVPALDCFQISDLRIEWLAELDGSNQDGSQRVFPQHAEAE